MSIETLFYTQVTSIIAFVVVIFVLYRLLVEQKDATITALKEKSSLLERELEIAKQSSSDTLLDRLSKRVDISDKELKKLADEVADYKARIVDADAILRDLRPMLVDHNEVFQKTLQEKRALQERFLGFLEETKIHFDRLEEMGLIGPIEKPLPVDNSANKKATVNP